MALNKYRSPLGGFFHDIISLYLHVTTQNRPLNSGLKAVFGIPVDSNKCTSGDYGFILPALMIASTPNNILLCIG